jgi:hypothetical protein
MDKFENYAWIGGALLATQRVEFLTHGIISHYKTIKEEKEFKNLTPRVFLDDTPENRKLRKQTLGQIFRILKKTPNLSIECELEEYLEKRNILIHELWRKYFKNNSEDLNLASVNEFCVDFIDRSSKIEKYYKGLMYAIAKHIAEINKLEIPDKIKELKINYKYFIDCLIANRLL